MRAWFLFLRFQPQRIDFVIGLAAPSEVTIIFRLVRTIAFDTLGPLNST